jgi:hypothetical protein
MLSVERNHNGAWIVTALVADGKSCGEWYKTVTYYDYTKTEACLKYMADYENIIVEDED